MFDSVHTWNQLRMIMNEKLLTHKPTHRGWLRGIKGSIVWWVLKKNNMENTNTISALSEFFFTQKSDATLTSSWVFLCVFWTSWDSGIGGGAVKAPWRDAGLSVRLPAMFSSYKSHIVGDEQQSSARLLVTPPAISAASQPSPVGTFKSKII